MGVTNSGSIPVAFLVSSLRFGGAEKHTLLLANHLDPQAFRPGLAYLKREEHLLDPVGYRPGMLWCGDFGKGWDTRGLLRLRAWLREFRPRILVCVNTYPLFYGHLAKILGSQDCRIVSVFHTTELPNNQVWKMRLVFRPLFNRCDRIVYVSEAQKRYWEGNGLRPDLGHCIHNGIDTEAYRDVSSPVQRKDIRDRYGFSQSDFVVGICAALRREKHHDDLLRAIARLKSQGFPAKCLIIGEGVMRPDIEKWIAELGLEGDAAITGFQEDVRPFMATCDCLAIVSHQVETFSIAALEAMAMGKPMVMSRIGGAAEQVEDGVNGFLFERGDLDALTESLGRLSDRGLRERCGQASREIVVSRFGYATMLRKYEDLFRDLA